MQQQKGIDVKAIALAVDQVPANTKDSRSVSRKGFGKGILQQAMSRKKQRSSQGNNVSRLTVEDEKQKRSTNL